MVCAALGESVTVIGPLAALIVICSEEAFAEFASEVAVTVAVVEDDTEAGAV
jgi:hypothetical protein